MVLRNVPKLYEVAYSNFSNKNSKNTKKLANYTKYKKIASNISLLNYRYASAELMSIGAHQGARYYANLGLLKSMPYPSKMKSFFFWTYFGTIYFKILNEIRKISS